MKNKSLSDTDIKQQPKKWILIPKDFAAQAKNGVIMEKIAKLLGYQIIKNE